MDYEQKEKIAVFRFGVIFPLIEKNLNEYWGEKERILRELVSKEWEIPFSKRTFISKATILNWIKCYEEGGRKIEALFPKARGDRGQMRCIDDELLDGLIQFRKKNPKLSTTRLVNKAKSEGVIPQGKEISMASVYRLMKQHKLKAEKVKKDHRKFEVQMSNDLWQSDCMHGLKVLHQGKNRKSYLFAVLDDHSRLITHGQFYLSESLENYLDCLWTAFRKRGIPRKLYVDNGPSFRSHRLQLGCASLEIGLSYARPYKPQGKGKIERFFRTVRTQFLPELPETLSLEELNAMFFRYLDDVYHSRIHGGTGQTPVDRYLEDAKSLRQAPADLPQYFRKQATRRVNNDRTVKLDGRLFEAPVGLIGSEVVLRFENYDRIEVFVDDESKGFLRALDQEVNSRIKREQEKPEGNTLAGGSLFENYRKAGNE
ncbi:MAG: DDE-type integrase/transposase/recombinase [Chitinispirillaceae bacterium]|nr:DDE-type integrase/transposase/recombinase [Chitinispirillaceae bacterium]